MAIRSYYIILYHTTSYYIILYHTISYYIIIYIRIYIYCYLYHLFGVPALRQFHSASGAFWIHNSWARNRLKLCDFGLWLDCILGWHSWWISALVPWQTTKIWQISARHGMFRDVQRRLGTEKFMYFVITYDYPINSELEFRIVFFPVRSIFFQSSSQLGAVHPFHALRSTTFEPGSSAKSVVAVWSCLRLVTSRITEYFFSLREKKPLTNQYLRSLHPPVLDTANVIFHRASLWPVAEACRPRQAFERTSWFSDPYCPRGADQQLGHWGDVFVICFPV